MKSLKEFSYRFVKQVAEDKPVFLCALLEFAEDRHGPKVRPSELYEWMQKVDTARREEAIKAVQIEASRQGKASNGNGQRQPKDGIRKGHGG